MVELYWPRNTTFSKSTPSGIEKFRPGLHEIDEERVEAFKQRGWVDPSDEDVDVEIDRGDATVTVDDASDEGDQQPEEEVELEEDELSLSTGDSDESEDEFDAEEFVDRTPQKEVIVDLESGEYDELLDEIDAAESDGRDRRGVERAIAERREQIQDDA